jgi:hypothetical protein
LHISEKSSTFVSENKKLMLFESQIHDLLSWLPWVRIRREQAAMRAIMEQRRRILTKEEVAEASARIIAQIEQMCIIRLRAIGMNILHLRRWKVERSHWILVQPYRQAFCQTYPIP